MAVNTSDPAIRESFKELTAAECKINWMMCKLDGKNVTLCGSGNGGLEEIRSYLSSDEVMWGVLKVDALDVKKNVTSKRIKLIYFTYIGADVPVMKKAKVSLISNDVSKLFPGVSINMNVSDPSDLDKDNIAKELLKVGGAHKPTMFRFGPDCEVQVTGAATA